MTDSQKSKSSTDPATKPAQRRLGRGLSSLIDMPSVPVEVTAADRTGGTSTGQSSDKVRPDLAGESGIQSIPISQISPSRFQPRKDFSERSLDELAASIKRSGLMQPIIVREKVGGFELVAGERRWRAASRAGLERLPAVVRELSDADVAEWAIVENVQREDLNAMEKAWAFRSLSEQFGLSHAEVAARVGLERSSVANLIRLTELEPEVAALVADNRLTGGHGKALLTAPAGPARIVLAKRAAEEQWSVRKLEGECVSAASKPVNASAAVDATPDDARVRSAMVADLERQLGEYLGTKVVIATRVGAKKGRIEVAFYDLDHFDDVMSRMGFKMK